MRPPRRPSTGTLLGFLALMVALGGTAFAATGQLVHIADGTNAARLAKVDAAGKVLMGDGTGNLTVDGKVTASESVPSTWFRFNNYAINAVGCRTLYAPPAGKSAVVQTLAVDTYLNPSPGSGEYVAFWVGSSPCSGALVLDVNPPGIGLDTVPITPGLGIPAGHQLSARAGGSVQAELYGFGYTGGSNMVPSSAVARGTTQTERPPQDR